MGTVRRFFKHVFTTGGAARRAFPQATLDAIQALIGDGETRHRAQLKLIIEPALDWSDLLDGTSSRARAHALFSRYRIWDTAENCGVLVYINLADHKVEIVTDRGVGAAVQHAEWETACRLMTQGFGQGKFHDSVLAGVAHVNVQLEESFPDNGSRERGNEVSDRPVLL